MTTSIDPALDAVAPSVTTPEANWFWDEGVPGTGNKPDWLGDKYKSVAEKAKAHSALEQRLGKTPQEYDLSKGESWIDPDYVPFQDMIDYAKNNHVTQDVMDKMLDSVSKYLDEFNVDYSAEVAKMGDNAEQRLQILDNWAQANLSPESYLALSTNIRTAEGLKALEEVRMKMTANNTQIPNSNSIDNVANAPSLQDIQAEMNMNIDKYKSDPIYRKEMLGKMELAARAAGMQDRQAY